MADKNYGIDDINHLDTREAMRTRIQMYLGSDDTDGIYQALKEIINNSTDEAIAGYGDQIEVTLDEKYNSVTIRDYGRGVPFGIKDGRNILVAIYTESHTGGKFNNDVYKNSSGLNGIGGTAVCMSSSYFIVSSIRDDIVATASFKQGILENYNEKKTKNLGEFYSKNGTFIEFKPDKEVFKNADEGFNYERICSEIKNISYLNKGVHFIVSTTSGKRKEFFSKNGIADFIRDNVEKPLMTSPIIVSKSDGVDEMEIAFMWTGGSYKEYVFVNGLYCPEGGAPVTGAKTTITTSMKRLTGKDFSPDLIRKGLVFAINCRVKEPSFANQTKSKINNPSLRTLASAAFKEGLENFANTGSFASIVEMMVKFQKAEKAADKAREAVLSHTKEMNEIRKNKLAFIEKLSDAEQLGQDAILCIVEGDSAGSSVAMGRDTKKYGILRIRGKMKNCLKAEDEEVYKNEEIKLLLYALGIDINNYNSSKLRYGKVAICVDADDDGYHIALLIMANLHKVCPQFLKENRLCWLRSPLFIEQDKNNNPISWYYTDEDFNKARGKLKGNVKRIKGLGALSEKDLRATMFSTTGGQVLDDIEYSPEGVEQLCALMGTDITPRKDFVMNRIDFSQYGDM